MFTVNVKSVDAVAVPSLTVMVIVDDPVWLAIGVNVTVRFAPLPPNEMFASGTSASLLDAPDTVSVPTGLSGSDMVNAMAPVGVFSGVD